uniref:Uncharacterized protein n=1 Tax=Peronospora matthiolae TaxID=2874970 RepID=A0AAV1T2C3_9STRA
MNHAVCVPFSFQLVAGASYRLHRASQLLQTRLFEDLYHSRVIDSGPGPISRAPYSPFTPGRQLDRVSIRRRFNAKEVFRLCDAFDFSSSIPSRKNELTVDGEDLVPSPWIAAKHSAGSRPLGVG